MALNSGPASGSAGSSRQVVMLVDDHVRLLDVAGPLEVFSVAAEMGGAYSVAVCSPTGSDVVTTANTTLAVRTAAADLTEVDTLVVPGYPHLPRRPPSAELLESVHHLTGDARRVTSVCTGAFVLAAAGWLDGRRATTHWRHTAWLARAFPRISVSPDALFVRDGPVYTSAGVTAGIDLCLALVEDDEGADLAREVAKDLVVFMQRPGGQSQFSVPARTPPPGNDLLRDLLDHVAADPAGDHSLPAMAARANLSTRHLSRLFADQVGVTPAAYVQSVRLEAAQALLEAGASVTSAGRHSGLGSDEAIRRVFLRELGITPSSYRARFQTAMHDDPIPRHKIRHQRAG